MLVMVSWELYPETKWMHLPHLVKCLKRMMLLILGWM